MGIERFFTSGITYKVPTITRDSTGGEIITLGTAVPILGRIRPLTAREILAAEKMNLLSTHMLYCLPEENLTIHCMVYFKSIAYRVVSIENPMTYDRHWQVSLERKQ